VDRDGTSVASATNARLRTLSGALGVLPIQPPARADLALLRALLRHGTLRDAARAVKTPQQVADRRIANLERRLGVALIESDHDGERLTQSGWVLLSAGSRLMHSVENVLSTIREAPSRAGVELIPTLRLAMFGHNWCGLADDLAVRLPGLLVNPIRATPTLALDMFERHHVDAAYIWMPADGELEIERPAELAPVFEEPLWVALPVDHPCARQSRISPADLAADTWIVGPAPESRRLLRSAYHGLPEPVEFLVAESSPQLRGLVGHGLGVALVSPLVSHPGEGARLILRPLAGSLQRRLLLVTDSRVIRPELADVLVSSLRDTYQRRARQRNPAYADSVVDQGPAAPMPDLATADTLLAGLTVSANDSWDDSSAKGLEPEDIYVLRVINECGSLNQAAPALLTSQPALTRRVGRLERRVGLALLVRGRRGTVLTPRARELLDGVRDAEVAFRSVVLDCCQRRRGLVDATA
jgi:DNA-binding transcriptional LysR family regulator